MPKLEMRTVGTVKTKRVILNNIETMKEEMRQKRMASGIGSNAKSKAQDLYTDKKAEVTQEADNFRRSASRGRIRKGSVYNTRPAGLHKQKI